MKTLQSEQVAAEARAVRMIRALANATRLHLVKQLLLPRPRFA